MPKIDLPAQMVQDLRFIKIKRKYMNSHDFEKEAVK